LWWWVVGIVVVVGAVAAASAWLGSRSEDKLTEVRPTAQVPTGGELVWICQGCQGTVGGLRMGVLSIWEEAGVTKAHVGANWCGPSADMPDLVLGERIEVDGCGTFELAGIRRHSSSRYAAAIIVVPAEVDP
jgi:hypothetical protein